MLLWGEDKIFVNWRCINTEQMDEIAHSCKTVAILTTAYARMCLRKSLVAINKNESLENSRLLYTDTDSIFYVDSPNRTVPDDLPLGNGLGQLSNMLAKYGPNTYITEFVAIAPKAYSYTVYNPDTNETVEVNKCKGISTNTSQSEKLLTFANLERIVDKSIDSLTFTDLSKIKRKKPFKVETITEKKKIQYTYNKRIRIFDHITVPYGYDLRSVLANKETI